jgi:hypothetical protein
MESNGEIDFLTAIENHLEESPEEKYDEEIPKPYNHKEEQKISIMSTGAVNNITQPGNSSVTDSMNQMMINED